MITLDQKLAEYLNNWTVGADKWPIGNFVLCAIALVLCTLLVGLVGIEREKRGRSAGLRTHLLVGLGSCLLMIISIYGFPANSGNRDVARLAAQIITGVGFLGAGAIIHLNSGIKGLTTAGTIWSSMAIGLACGSFNFIIAIVGTTLIVLVLTYFKRIEVKINRNTPTLVVKASIDKPVLGGILQISKEYDCSIHSVSSEIVEDSDGKLMQITFQAVFPHGEEKLPAYMEALSKEDGVKDIHFLSHNQ